MIRVLRDSDNPRTVAKYAGCQIQDTREYVRIVLTRKPPRGMKTSLRTEGFTPTDTEGTWQRRHSPIAAITATAICNTFFDKENS